MDGDGRLIGEGLQERDVLRGEDPRRRAAHGEHADDLASHPQGYREAGDDADPDIPLAKLGAELEAVIAADIAGPHGTPLDGRPPDEPDARGHDFTDAPIFLGETSQGERPQHPVRPREPDGRAVHSQQPQHAFRDPITHGGQIQGLADESADSSQLEGLVLLLHELGPTSRVFEEENGLVPEDGQKGELLIRIAPPRPVGEHEGAHHLHARAERHGGKRGRTLACGQRGGLDRKVRLGEDVRRTDRPALSDRAAAHGDIGAGGATVRRLRITLTGRGHTGEGFPVRIEPVQMGTAAAEEPQRRGEDPLGGRGEVESTRRLAPRSEVGRGLHDSRLEERFRQSQ